MTYYDMHLTVYNTEYNTALYKLINYVQNVKVLLQLSRRLRSCGVRWWWGGGVICRKLWPTSSGALGMQLGTAHKARLTCCFEPPLLSNMGFSIWGENWCYKQSKREPSLDTGLHKSSAYAQICRA